MSHFLSLLVNINKLFAMRAWLFLHNLCSTDIQFSNCHLMLNLIMMFETSQRVNFY